MEDWEGIEMGKGRRGKGHGLSPLPAGKRTVTAPSLSPLLFFPSILALPSVGHEKDKGERQVGKKSNWSTGEAVKVI